MKQFLCFCVMSFSFCLPSTAMSECRTIERADMVEVDCTESSQPEAHAAGKMVAEKIQSNKNFYFYSPEKAGTKISIFGDMTANAIANPDDTILEVYIEDSRFEYTSVKSYKYKSRSGNDTFIIEESDNFTDENVKTLNVYLDSSSNFRLPSSIIYSGCGAVESFVSIKTKKLEGNRLHYQLVVPECIQSQLMIAGQ